MRLNQPCTECEVPIRDGATLVSKTDLKGLITWVNDEFEEVSGYTRQELIGQPHNLIRHPDMPEAAFANLWRCLEAGEPWVGIVKNRCKSGHHYWVEAHVTPYYEDGRCVGFMSVRRAASREAILHAERVYASLRAGRGGFRLRHGRLEPRKPLRDANPLWLLSLRARLHLFALFTGGLAALAAWMVQVGQEPGRVLGLIAGGTLFACYSAHWLSRDLAGRLSLAVHAFKRLSGGDYDVPIDVSRTDEVGAVLLQLEALRIRLGFEVQDLNLRNVQTARVRQGLDAAATAVMLTDSALKVIYVNDALRKTFARVDADLAGDDRFAPAGIVGRSLAELLPDRRQATAAFEAQHQLKSQQLVVGGHTLTLLTTPVSSADGRRIGYVAEWRDRTDAVAVEQEIRAVLTAASEGDFSRRIELRQTATNDFFMELVGGFNKVLDINTQALDDIVSVIGSLAQGDLTRVLEGKFSGTLAKVQADINATVQRLSGIVGHIQQAAEATRTATSEIVSGSTDLAQRTEREAANLSQTATQLHELTDTVQRNAQDVGEARRVAERSSAIAGRGSEAVNDVVAAMKGIAELSRKIAEITAVIDGIAFQTNILALNSAVEAARAGEHGRGFAVVASEVRSLAQRVATAAREIKALTESSALRIDQGAKAVETAGTTMQDILSVVRDVSRLMAQIAAATDAQSVGIQRVHQTVAQLDEATQHNAALVEETSASARSLEQQSTLLSDAVAVFRTRHADLGMTRARVAG
jgi:methyl-accepting chemotaxis protein